MHTPGPWTAVCHEKQCGDGVCCPQGGWVVEWGHGTSSANARLIAAAPDLLKAAEEVCQSIGGRFSSPDIAGKMKLKAAIAKAKGESVDLH